jgi:putative hydrolase of the HAD superfamily
MNKKIIILDLDNTIYPVSSIGAKLFKNLFTCIEKNGEFTGSFEDIKQEIQRTPFQKVAKDFLFSDKLLDECTNIHANLTYNEPMQTFEDYSELKKLPQKKYLVTSGFTQLQKSKVKQLGIESDFEEIHIIDMQISKQTKKDIFQLIIQENNYTKNEVLIVGDDLKSEIKAGNELGIATVWYDRERKHPDRIGVSSISSFTQLKAFL